MKGNPFVHIKIAMLLSTVALTGYVSSASGEIMIATPVAQEKSLDSFVANNVPIAKVFDAVSSRLGKPIILSKTALQKKVTGNFDLSQPAEMFKSLARRTALVWYDDGASIYIYDNSEIRNQLISTRSTSWNELINYLKTAGIYDSRFPVRSQNKSSVIYVSGPPMYVELVTAAAHYLDEQNQMQETAGRDVTVIPLKHSSVNDRVYTQRGQTITIPGMVSVINSLFENGIPGNKITVVPRGDTAEHQIEEGFPKPPSVKNLTANNVGINRGENSDKFAVVAHPNSNSLLVTGSAEQTRYIHQLVRALDSSRRQVELSLWIIDISKKKLDEVGVRWSIGDLKAGGGGIAFNQSTLSNSAKFLARVDAISRTGDAQIVSRPIVLTQENIPALFDNNSSFYARLEGERVAKLEQVTYGTMVSVLPRISQGDQVEMDVNIEDGSPGRAGSNDVDQIGGLPIVNRTNISTVARIAKDSSLLIGGYTRDQLEESDEKIPLLGSIPYLGRLFSYRSSNQQKMIRVFLIQPRLLNESESWDGRQFSEKDRLSDRIINKNEQLQASVKLLQTYMSRTWQ
ncbi:type III secretion system outer membrane ring subunit SctC [Yersinia ruckeri]|uniref:Type 3 secretion system secretin n=1 Tax=Yersinia ruckeri TaxID=29486 RepID=A0A085U446_YERRU|nr:type III secretion system outer membrane ring subunit SctC [Yersinia ruckeri]ARZ02146.1 type III secretion system protein [Yersinia ruckeri]KFE37959.1 type III secretion system protein [Yersinia ruckeri]KGA50292.1 type III secretion outer membrane pore, YscC/HrcC family [Yersinia ruckeri ATCC 29473]MCK8540469.1 type III secretion system outer membrane ring subunit SctC [Yersinia ruckeri]MCK8541602.1 type III secretion system outer membrane ring subunit SctC [Yersinia ruckeri]